MLSSMEAFLGESLVSFDGRIVEGFGPRAHTRGRMHISTLDAVSLEVRGNSGYLLFRVVWRTEQLLFPFPLEQLPLAEALAAEVQQAMDAIRRR